MAILNKPNEHMSRIKSRSVMRFATALCFAGALFCTTGCQLMDAGKKVTSYTRDSFKPKSAGYRDTSLESSDDWSFVGQEARGDRPREQDPDPWWQQLVMSPRARSIEKNLGID